MHHCFFFFFFNDTATTEIYTLSLHDALPISGDGDAGGGGALELTVHDFNQLNRRSEEHTSELQSRQYLVCRLLLEKKKKMMPITTTVSATATPKTIQIHHPPQPLTIASTIQR